MGRPARYYGEYNATVNRTAHALLERGVQRGDRIAVLSHNCRDFVVAYFALAKLGAISVPINFMLSAAEVAYILGHSGASGYVVEDALAGTMLEAIERSARAARRPCTASSPRPAVHRQRLGGPSARGRPPRRGEPDTSSRTTRRCS